MSTLAALVRRAHAIGAHVDRIPVPVRFGGRTWRTSTRWVDLDTADAILRVNHSALPHHPTWTVSAYWGHRRERYLESPTIEQLGVLLDDITSAAPAEPVVMVEPLGQLSLMDLLAAVSVPAQADRPSSGTAGDAP